ncbi:MAG: DUF503 domain-containing protein [Desulfatirhabdiaceae bacterium]
MVVGYGILTLRLYDCHSLKEKRSVVKSFIGRIQSHFKMSVAEVGDNDIHQKAQIGFALVGNDRRLINSIMDRILEMAHEFDAAEVVDSEMEIMTL